MDKRLIRLIVGCHMDKELLEAPPASVHDLFVQAGAALTDKRLYPFNDHDGFEQSISDRNMRYSEMTAVFWAYHRTESDYIAIEHYRRRFLMGEEELDRLMDSGVELITLKKLDLGMSLWDFMNQQDFVHAFAFALDIVKEMHPEDHELALELAGDRYFRPCNMNIWSRPLFDRYCSWLFPMLDEFYHRVPQKTDICLRRDAGYMAERLTYVFVEKLIREGVAFAESDYRKYESRDNAVLSIPDISDGEAFMEKIEELYAACRIENCRDAFMKAYNSLDDEAGKPFSKYARVFHIYMDELKQCELSLFEYLPEDMRKSLGSVADAVLELGKNVVRLLMDPSPETEEAFAAFIRMTSFSLPAVFRFSDGISDQPAVRDYISAVMGIETASCC